MAIVDVVVESEDWDSWPELPARIEQAVLAGLNAAGVTTLPTGEIAVLLTDDEGIAALNERWRGKAKATNVLSWPASSVALLPVAPMIGDIAIAFETCRAEAEAEGKAFADHVAHLAVHGTLHLVGMDHETEEDAQRMEGLERIALAGLGIADPYAGLSGSEEKLSVRR